MEKNIKKPVRMMRIDPLKRTVAAITVRIGKNASPELRRVCRCKSLGWREVTSVGDHVIAVVAPDQVEPEVGAWRLRGGDDTAGISLLFARGPGQGMTDLPNEIDAQWVLDRIEWIDGEDFAGLQARAVEILTLMNDGLVNAVLAAFPNPADGSMWIPVDHKAEFEALMTLGICTQSSGGQRLTPVGVQIHDALSADGQ